MDSKAVRCFAVAVTLVVALAAPSVAQGAPALTASEMEEFLRNADIVDSARVDTDRNQHNILYGSDWKVWMIDFTRAFRVWGRLLNVNALVKCDRQLLERLQSLDKDQVKDAVGRHLTKSEIKGLMERRDLVVARFDELIAERSAAAVLY